MFTLTPEMFSYLLERLWLMAMVSGLVGAVLWDLIQLGCIGLVSFIGELIDRKGRIKRSRERAASLRCAGERFVRVADRMDARAVVKPADEAGHG
ncbi:hypothetical protein GCM10010975_28910 [Comamonas phosphati]|nr:hypothetical protein GCM10010975_28910 [Comamonas phosphati]